MVLDFSACKGQSWHRQAVLQSCKFKEAVYYSPAVFLQLVVSLVECAACLQTHNLTADYAVASCTSLYAEWGLKCREPALQRAAAFRAQTETRSGKQLTVIFTGQSHPHSCTPCNLGSQSWTDRGEGSAACWPELTCTTEVLAGRGFTSATYSCRVTLDLRHQECSVCNMALLWW